MKLVFSKAQPDFVETTSSPEDLFEGLDGNLYMYQLEVESENDGNGIVRIIDNVNRTMTLDFEDLGPLIKVLSRVKAYADDQAAFNEFWEAEFKRG